MSFSIKIKYIREQLKMSQREFSEKIGYSQASVAQWELGQKNPKFEALTSIFELAKSKRVRINKKEFFSIG